MQWNNFQFCCRYLHQKMSEGIDLESAHKTLLKSYQRYLPEQLNNNFIYQAISTSQDQQSLLSIYGKIEFEWDKSLLTKLSDIKSYLMAIVAIFIITSLIVITHVLPVFKEAFELFDHPIRSQIDNFYIFWLGSVTVIVLSSALLLLFAKEVKRIKNESTPSQFSFLSKMLLSKKITNQIYKTEALTYSALEKDINEFSHAENVFYAKLKNDNLDIPKELSILINEQYLTLTQLINQRLKLYLSYVTACITVGIANFVYNLYTPIFSMGTLS